MTKNTELTNSLCPYPWIFKVSMGGMLAICKSTWMWNEKSQTCVSLYSRQQLRIVMNKTVVLLTKNCDWSQGRNGTVLKAHIQNKTKSLHVKQSLDWKRCKNVSPPKKKTTPQKNPFPFFNCLRLSAKWF